ncbi:head-tail connector protein [Stakelama pacifica]|uniref:Putative phiE125 gp8 family phage protein n=1 Tax=Stakelama pacifica TaxID=517720 RepID=A0A4R6FU87_9SPHN|nr:hypothetical protein [Stakelama pacifica]TDN85373.1 putative phiE125 gp8 family phage protein [Stakelama pacifica]GGO92840.1 hypothetical protein GCM10011329_10880 [Stakelama pacifica]
MQPPFPAAAIAAARDAAAVYLRDGSSVNQARIEAIAGAALSLAEAFTGQALMLREHVAVLPVTGEWMPLPTAPVAAVTQVAGLPAEGAAFALPVGAYAVDVDARGEGWVRVIAPGIAGRVQVTFSAGLSPDWEHLPHAIRQGVVLLIAHLSDERSADDPPPAAVTALWRPFRRMRLAAPQAFRAAVGG